MEPVKITLNGKTFELNFSLRVFRLIGEKIGTKTLDETLERIGGTIDGLVKGDFETILLLYEVLVVAVKANPANTEELTVDELEDTFFTRIQEQSEALQSFVVAMMAILPEDEMGKLQALMAEQTQPQPNAAHTSRGTSSSKSRAAKSA